MNKLLGLVIAATGIAHFIQPDLFRDMTKVAFPHNTDQAIQQNGAIETGVGLAIACGKTRKLGFLGLLAYTGWLGFNAAQNQ
ncbi:MAG: hypothetical protein QM648_01080 [Solirubrobacterales bacterium]